MTGEMWFDAVRGFVLERELREFREGEGAGQAPSASETGGGPALSVYSGDAEEKWGTVAVEIRSPLRGSDEVQEMFYTTLLGCLQDAHAARAIASKLHAYVFGLDLTDSSIE